MDYLALGKSLARRLMLNFNRTGMRTQITQIRRVSFLLIKVLFRVVRRGRSPLLPTFTHQCVILRSDDLSRWLIGY